MTVSEQMSCAWNGVPGGWWMAIMYKRPSIDERLLELLRQRALSRGGYRLSSGKDSETYVDSKRVLLNSEALMLIGELIYQATKELRLRAIGGPEMGAVPMTASAILAYYLSGKVVEGFFVRKEAKEHGSKNTIEGLLRPGDQTLIVDDVVTTGRSVMRAIKEVEKVGARVAGVFCLVDREEGAKDLLSDYRFFYLFTLKDLLKER